MAAEHTHGQPETRRSTGPWPGRNPSSACSAGSSKLEAAALQTGTPHRASPRNTGGRFRFITVNEILDCYFLTWIILFPSTY